MLSHVIWAQIHGTASLALSGRLAALPDGVQAAFFDATVEATIRGLRATPR